MLRFDKAKVFFFLKSNLSVILSIKTSYLEVLLFSEFIKIVSFFFYYTFIDLIMLLYTFLVTSLD